MRLLGLLLAILLIAAPAYVPVAINADCEFEFKHTAQNPPGGIALTPGVDLQFNFVVAEWSGKPDLFPWLNE